MEKRPILQLRLTKFDYLLEFLAIGILVFHWIFMLNYYCKLPLIIPSHIDSNGEIDGMGSKNMLCLVPIIGLLLYIAISYTNKKPHCFNFPYPITAENAERQYRNSLMMMRVMKMLVQLVFLFVTANIISTALPFGLKFVGLWMFPFGISLVFICMFFFVFRGFKLK
jgi:uncharacterized membrane protein